MRVPELEQPVVQVLFIGGERAFAVTDTADNRHDEVEHRDEHTRCHHDDRTEERENIGGTIERHRDAARR